jgi:hypothetical protein
LSEATRFVVSSVMRFSLVLALLAAGCATAPAATSSNSMHARDYFPLSVGSHWKYQLTPSTPDTPTAEVKIVDKDAQGFFIDDKGGRLAPRTDGVFDGVKNRFWIEEPLEAGHEWIAVPKDDPSKVEHLKIVDTATSVHEPAGQFDGCLVVEATEPDKNPHTGEPVVIRSTWTFAPKVGLVKLVEKIEPQKSPPFTAVTMDLVSFEVK